MLGTCLRGSCLRGPSHWWSDRGRLLSTRLIGRWGPELLASSLSGVIKTTSPLSAAFGRLVVAVASLAAMVVGVGLVSVFGKPPTAPVAEPPPGER